MALLAARHLTMALPSEPESEEPDMAAEMADEPEPPHAHDASEDMPSVPKPTKIMEDLDTNHDGKVTHDELVARLKWVDEKECVRAPGAPPCARSQPGAGGRTWCTRVCERGGR